jgi:glycosyltransferase involved in cell wall biosynthesis
MKVSLICTVLNEEDSIGVLIDSLLSQTRPADEIVIIDGGSRDQTLQVARSFVPDPALVRLHAAKSANIAQGRNTAIKMARHDIIASIDGGCRADSDWLRNLIEPFEEDATVDVVAGYWLPEPKTAFEECLGELIYPRMETLDETQFLPSARSIAFRRECWQAVGGYPEWLYTGEDSLFDLRLRDAGYRFALAENAIVYWRPRATWQELFKQYYLYARGAAEAKIVSRTIGKAYGANVIVHVFHAMKSMLLRRRTSALFYSFACLPVILAAKVTGLCMGKVGLARK